MIYDARPVNAWIDGIHVPKHITDLTNIYPPPLPACPLVLLEQRTRNRLNMRKFNKRVSKK